MRIGIFGGTFNPPHNGHKKLAREFAGRLSLDLLLIVPDYIPPHKEASVLAGEEDRFNMCRLCFDDSIMLVSDIEIKRKGRSYTVNTLEELKAKYPDDELYFLMGSDMLLSFHRWREPERILDYAVICAGERIDGETESLKAYVEEYFHHRKDRFVIMDFEPVEISSTKIRNEKLSDSSVLPEKVMAYIQERGLYT